MSTTSPKSITRRTALRRAAGAAALAAAYASLSHRLGAADETQELYYPAIMKAVLDTGFDGFVAQEFIPARADKIASLKQGVTICDV